MTERTQADHAASRRTVLLCAGLTGAVGAGALLTACSTAAVPYDANEQGQAPGPALAAATDPAAAPATASAPAAGSAGSAGSGGTLLGRTTEVPVGGGTVFTDAKVVVTQPTKGVFKAFS